MRGKISALQELPRTKVPMPDSARAFEWLRDYPAVRELEDVHKAIEATADAYDKGAWFDPLPPSATAGVSHAALMKEADAFRGRIKESHLRTEVLHDVVGHLIDWKQSRVYGDQACDDYVAEHTLNKGTAKRQELAAAVLKDLGIAP